MVQIHYLYVFYYTFSVADFVHFDSNIQYTFLIINLYFDYLFSLAATNPWIQDRNKLYYAMLHHYVYTVAMQCVHDLTAHIIVDLDDF